MNHQGKNCHIQTCMTRLQAAFLCAFYKFLCLVYSRFPSWAPRWHSFSRASVAKRVRKRSHDGTTGSLSVRGDQVEAAQHQHHPSLSSKSSKSSKRRKHSLDEHQKAVGIQIGVAALAKEAMSGSFVFNGGCLAFPRTSDSKLPAELAMLAMAGPHELVPKARSLGPPRTAGRRAAAALFEPEVQVDRSWSTAALPSQEGQQDKTFEVLPALRTRAI